MSNPNSKVNSRVNEPLDVESPTPFVSLGITKTVITYVFFNFFIKSY